MKAALALVTMKQSIESLLNLQSLLTDAIDGATSAMLAAGEAHMCGLADASDTCEALRLALVRLNTQRRNVRASIDAAHAEEADSE